MTGRVCLETRQVAGHFTLAIYQITYTYLQEPTDIQ